MVTMPKPRGRYKYRLVSDHQAAEIRRLYMKYSMLELARYLPLSYPTIRAIIRESGAYQFSEPGVPDCLSVQEALQTYFEVQS